MDMIRVENLVKRFGPIEAVKSISFTVNEGEIFGFLGPNGAGKSTTIKMLSTLLLPTSGQAFLAGYDVVKSPLQVRRSIGVVFQDYSLDDRLTAEENLYIHAMLYNITGGKYRERRDRVLDLVDLSDRRKSLVRTFSGGMKRRLEIARGLLHYPKVLFLDEPTIGLDPQTRRAIWDHVRSMQQETGSTVFMTTHYMEEAENCTRIGIIDNGEIVALDSPAELKRRVGGDIITVQVDDRESFTTSLKEKYGFGVREIPDGLSFEVENGPEFILRLAADYQGVIRRMSVHQPTLDDAFIKLTGRTIRTESADARDVLRSHMRFTRGGR